ncbi:MAG: lipid-A-disaccharide synthase [Candidatus Melainabacteria bacterium]|jgi:lipid-A-disaccharide synthase|nr:MAG: lipid-A-disaccharide synthase [Candidatus Melainabacteria bacterium]
MKKLFIITGEYSGDIHAANVVRELKALDCDLQIEGIGGINLEKEGVKLFATQEKMSAMGISPKIIVDHFKLGKSVVDYLKNEYKPDLVLLIDYGAFNLSVAGFLHAAGIKIFYYIPPQVWASRKYRINLIKKFVDKVLCIFPFEKQLYAQYGIDTHYCGHPLVSQLPPAAGKREFFRNHGLDIEKKLVSVFPGSRKFELENLMGVFKETVKRLQHRHPDLQFCISQAPNLSDEIYNKYLGDCDIKVIKGENQALLSVSDALILASGTVALEACLYKTPMIIAYRGPWILYLGYLLLRCIKRVSLPNIIADKSIVPEIIQKDVTPLNITYEIEELLYNQDRREKNIKELGEVKELLSNKNSALEVAKVIDTELFS